jgi:hypothetical protein
MERGNEHASDGLPSFYSSLVRSVDRFEDVLLFVLPASACPDGKDMIMAERRKYSRRSGSDVKSEMHRYKHGTAKSGPGGRGGTVKSRKQAIAIGLSKARKKGKKVPAKKT